MKFYNEGAKVFMDRGNGLVAQICTVNPAMLTPTSLAEEIAAAMNEKFGKT